MAKDYIDQIQHIRKLALRVYEISLTDENEKKRKRWANHNERLHRDKPPVWICPDDDGGWLELIPPETIICTDPDLHWLERVLVKYLYQHEYFPDDFVLEAKVYCNYPGVYTGYLYGDSAQKMAWGLAVEKPSVGKNAYHLNSFLVTEEDYQALLSHEVDFIPDETEKSRLSEKLGDALDGILALEFHLPYSVLVQSHLIELVHLRGLEELMYDLYDDDERLEQVLCHMAESKARLLLRLEEKKLLFDNRTNIYTGSGSLGYTNEPWKSPQDVKLRDMWGFADAQEFSAISPEMFERFALKNQRKGLRLFGRSCYGCCEPLDRKYDAIYRNIPNICRLSVSPWSNLEEAVERIGKNAIFSWKPNPALICTGFDEAETYRWLQSVAKLTKDCFVEIILKDIRTCANTNQHLIRFTQLANQAFAI